MAFAYAVANAAANDSAGTLEYLEALAPWMSQDEAIATRNKARSLGTVGRDIGKLVRMTEEERRACKAWQLQSIDGLEMLERERERKQASRRARGVKSRAERGSESIKQRARAAGIPETTYRRMLKRGETPVARKCPGLEDENEIEISTLLTPDTSAPPSITPTSSQSVEP
jgi:hypothetical protein